MAEVYITIVETESRDWFALYVDNDLFADGHEITRNFWVELIETHKYFKGPVRFFTVSDEDTEEMGSSFPYKFDEIPPQYLKGGGE